MQQQSSGQAAMPGLIAFAKLRFAASAMGYLKRPHFWVSFRGAERVSSSSMIAQR
jgi:hypothetical protein